MIADCLAGAWLLITGLIAVGLVIGGLQMRMDRAPWWQRRYTMACRHWQPQMPLLWLVRHPDGRWEWQPNRAKATAFPIYDPRPRLWAMCSSNDKGQQAQGVKA